MEHLLRSRGHGLSEPDFRAWRKAVRSGSKPPETDLPLKQLAEYKASAAHLAIEESKLTELLPRKLEEARAALLQNACAILPPYLVFANEGIRELLNKLATENPEKNHLLPPRNKQARLRERHLLLYLQRICSKNDTFSQFGPSVWGFVEAKTSGIDLVLQPSTMERDVYLERWTAHIIAAAINKDKDVRVELSPRVNPNGRIDGNQFVFTETGVAILTSPGQARILHRCDGRTAAHSLDGAFEEIEELAEQGLIFWEVQVPALDPHPFATLLADVVGWREGPVRTRWLEVLRAIDDLRSRFAQTATVSIRLDLMQRARQLLDDLGITRGSQQRILYTASNPIGEDCFRSCAFSISESMADILTKDAEPWIDLWRDCYAFIASRVAEGLRGLVNTAPVKNGAVPLPAFLRHCENERMSLTGHGLVALAHIAFREIKEAFRDSVCTRQDATEWMLQSEDCHFVRRNFDYPRFDEYTFPSADLQISAASREDVEAGSYEWVLSELHPPIAMLQHGVYWSCPDEAALSQFMARGACGKPNFYYGFSPADFTSHTTVRQFDALPALSNFVATGRANPNWRSTPPAETEVFINEENGDVGLRRRGSHEYLGSFARYWIIPLGFHPFYFGRAPHMPRLRCGKVIVQRESWTVSVEEFGSGNFNGISTDLVVAIERLRGTRGLPRFIYIRPTEQALQRSGAEGRDKDTKPVFIDLESYLFIEIFYRWLVKAGEIEVTEMLPDLNHLLWREVDGRRTFELRTLIVPRE